MFSVDNIITALFQQYFGWAFYAQVISMILHFLASFFGCIAASVAFKKAKAKLIKIEVSFSYFLIKNYFLPCQENSFLWSTKCDEMEFFTEDEENIFSSKIIQ